MSLILFPTSWQEQYEDDLEIDFYLHHKKELHITVVQTQFFVYPEIIMKSYFLVLSS
jgi:hypothetical protein